MKRGLGTFRKAAAAAAVFILLQGAAGPVTAESIDLTPEEAYRAAAAAVLAGNFGLADGLADALLQRSPDDFDTLLLKARTAAGAGKPDEAQDAARRAMDTAGTEAERYAAAMVMAQALAKDGKDTRAQLWLRRAVDLAPDNRMRALAVRDFRFVRARNPWATELSFNIAPTSNVNNGSRRETTKLYGLPFEFQLSGSAQALEGVEYSTGLATRYRFRQDAHTAHDIVFQFDHRSYVLSDDAKAQAPGVEGSDFALTQTSVGYVFRARPEEWIGPYDLGLTAGYSWYGGAPYLGYLRGNGSQSYRLADRTWLTFSAAAERQHGESAPDADRLSGDLRLVHGLPEIGALGLTIGRSASDSAAEAVDYTEWSAGIDLALAKPVFGAKVTLGIDWSYREFPLSRFDPADGRGDNTIEASVDFVFTDIERYGFNPSLTIVGSTTDSNVGIYESEEFGVRFGIRSAF